MQFDGLEKRRHPRHEYREIIECRLNLPFPPKIIFCPSVNLSESGVCIYTSHLLNEGTRVEISNLRTDSHQKAVVMWVSKRDEGFYKTGFMFLNWLILWRTIRYLDYYSLQYLDSQSVPLPSFPVIVIFSLKAGIIHKSECWKGGIEVISIGSNKFGKVAIPLAIETLSSLHPLTILLFFS